VSRSKGLRGVLSVERRIHQRAFWPSSWPFEAPADAHAERSASLAIDASVCRLSREYDYAMKPCSARRAGRSGASKWAASPAVGWTPVGKFFYRAFPFRD